MKAVLGAGAGRQTGSLQFAALRGYRQVLMMVKMMKIVVMMVVVVVVEMMEATTMDVVVFVVAVRLLVDYDRGWFGGIAVAVVTVDGDRRHGRWCWEGAGTRSWLAQAAVQHELEIGPRPASRYWLAA